MSNADLIRRLRAIADEAANALERLAHGAQNAYAERDTAIALAVMNKTLAETEHARAQEVRREMLEFRDCVLNQRGALAENGMSNDQVNDVLSEFDTAMSEGTVEPCVSPAPADQPAGWRNPQIRREALGEVLGALYKAANYCLGTNNNHWCHGLWQAQAIVRTLQQTGQESGRSGPGGGEVGPLPASSADPFEETTEKSAGREPGNSEASTAGRATASQVPVVDPSPAPADPFEGAMEQFFEDRKSAGRGVPLAAASDSPDASVVGPDAPVPAVPLAAPKVVATETPVKQSGGTAPAVAAGLTNRQVDGWRRYFRRHYDQLVSRCDLPADNTSGDPKPLG